MGNPNVNITNGNGKVATIDNTTTYTAPTGTYIRYIQVVNDAVIASYTDAAEVLDATALAGITITSGLLIEGKFTAITLTSGIVRCHLA